MFAVNFLGGATGDKVAAVLRSEHLPFTRIALAAETREGWTLRAGNSPATSVFEPSPAVTAAEVAALIDLVRRELRKDDWLVVTGTLPQGCPDTLYAELIALARQCGARSLLDARGPELAAALRTGPTIVKPNRHEYEQTFSAPLQTPGDFHRALAQLRATGAALALITDGPRPWYAADAAGVWQVTPPAIAEVNPIGSGDALAAALIAGITRGWPLARTLQFAGAVATANAAVWPVAAVSEAEANVLLPATIATRCKETHTTAANTSLS